MLWNGPECEEACEAPAIPKHDSESEDRPNYGTVHLRPTFIRSHVGTSR